MDCEPFLYAIALILVAWFGWFVTDNLLFWISELWPQWLPKWMRR